MYIRTYGQLQNIMPSAMAIVGVEAKKDVKDLKRKLFERILGCKIKLLIILYWTVTKCKVYPLSWDLLLI